MKPNGFILHPQELKIYMGPFGYQLSIIWLGTTWNPPRDHWWSPDHLLKTTGLQNQPAQSSECGEGTIPCSTAFSALCYPTSAAKKISQSSITGQRKVAEFGRK